MSLYIYGETAFHHQGDLNFLYELITLAKETGLEGVKFQVLIDADDFMSITHPIYKEFRKWVFSEEQWIEVFKHCNSVGLDVIVMPLDVRAFDVVKKSEIKYLDLHSVSFNDRLVLDKLKRSGIPVIVGIGGRTLDEVVEKISFFGDANIILMTGFQAFPTSLMDFKLNKIRKLKELFPNVSIGYADHTSFQDENCIFSNEYAFLLGATFIEKHITTTEGVKRVDYESAIGADKLKRLKARLDYLKMLTSFPDHELFQFSAPELNYRKREKVLVANQRIISGAVITLENVSAKVTGQEGGIASLDLVLGRKVIKDIELGILYKTTICNK